MRMVYWYQKENFTLTGNGMVTLNPVPTIPVPTTPVWKQGSEGTGESGPFQVGSLRVLVAGLVLWVGKQDSALGTTSCVIPYHCATLVVGVFCTASWGVCTYIKHFPPWLVKSQLCS